MEISDEKDIRLLHFGAHPFLEEDGWDDRKRSKFRLIELHVSGENQLDHHGSKHTGTSPGNRLKYCNRYDSRNDRGRKIEIYLTDKITNLDVTCHMQFYDNIPFIKSWSVVSNSGSEPVGLEYISSFALTGIDKEGLRTREDKVNLHIPHHTWFGEAQWKEYTLPELGFHSVNEFSMKRISYSSTGTWSTSEYAPTAVFENKEAGTCLAWQIEHHGSWHWEISDRNELLYLQVSGPTEVENQWWKSLHPGEKFETVPVAIGSVEGDFEEVINAMNQYRRSIRRENRDNESLPVIFNDYMNCLFGDPTTKKLMPLIDAAARAGCEIYCIDCGWYSDGEWWDGVGEWLPSKARFPHGIEEVMAHIRRKGMIPGLWLELEVMGINCNIASKVPDDWFFLLHGKRVIDHSRYQLDYRNSEVVAYANRVIDRLVSEYGVGYIKMDYNINAGVGTELNADSFGDGLLEHNRAYLRWLDQIFMKYPDLIIENCSSGGMRMDYALLSRHSIQSTSDQTDYVKNGVIAAASSSLVTPEQCAVWSYPLKDGDDEEVIFNMVNAILLRIHQSGHLSEITEDRFKLVAEAIKYYKSIREYIPKSKSIWPLGIPSFYSEWNAFGLVHHNHYFMAVWRMNSDSNVISIPLKDLKGEDVKVEVAYPKNNNTKWRWNKLKGELTVRMTETYSARLFEIRKCEALVE
ncbi:glycoside hydrolase family 36 protein [Evansella cellulosilytica]|uniref:Alpha-galactosidase n=1 Tax=Evansella cellulosilytica (strain ATCC 21833 / DSM 2522 / FERM P-1141 / JCM 9156 / N-4) TaxID=649639 RepID=E6TQZ7_EVAC2|nr:glycoside hydrolase family 36 protein [Evansella cellulosilytica]ADU29373.1 Alpha-galactosidase [Evansella cellulosilytica DSM 2522]